MPRQTENSRRTAEDIMQQPDPSANAMENRDISTGSGTSLEERISRMEEHSTEMYKDFSTALSDIRDMLKQQPSSSQKQAGRRQKQKHAEVSAQVVEDSAYDSEKEEEAETDSESDSDEETEPWRHLKINLVKCQNVVEKWLAC